MGELIVPTQQNRPWTEEDDRRLIEMRAAVDLSRLYRPRSGGLQVASPDVSLLSARGQKLRRMPVLLSPKTMLANSQREGLA